MKNKKILVFVFFLSLLIFVSNSYAEDLNMKVCFTYDRNNSFSISNFDVYVGKISSEYEPPVSKYVLKIFDSSSQVLFTKKLAISFFNPITNTIQEKNEACYEIPYFDKANKLKILYDNKEIFSADLKNNICNNNSVCELGENSNICPNDCKSQTEIPWLYIGIAVIVVIIIFVIYFISKKYTIQI